MSVCSRMFVISERKIDRQGKYSGNLLNSLFLITNRFVCYEMRLLMAQYIFFFPSDVCFSSGSPFRSCSFTISRCLYIFFTLPPPFLVFPLFTISSQSLIPYMHLFLPILFPTFSLHYFSYAISVTLFPTIAIFSFTFRPVFYTLFLLIFFLPDRVSILLSFLLNVPPFLVVMFLFLAVFFTMLFRFPFASPSCSSQPCDSPL